MFKKLVVLLLILLLSSVLFAEDFNSQLTELLEKQVEVDVDQPNGSYGISFRGVLKKITDDTIVLINTKEDKKEIKIERIIIIKDKIIAITEITVKSK